MIFDTMENTALGISKPKNCVFILSLLSFALSLQKSINLNYVD